MSLLGQAGFGSVGNNLWRLDQQIDAHSFTGMYCIAAESCLVGTGQRTSLRGLQMEDPPV
jgi:hypothetical protein